MVSPTPHRFILLNSIPPSSLRWHDCALRPWVHCEVVVSAVYNVAALRPIDSTAPQAMQRSLGLPSTRSKTPGSRPHRPLACFLQ